MEVGDRKDLTQRRKDTEGEVRGAYEKILSPQRSQRSQRENECNQAVTFSVLSVSSVVNLYNVPFEMSERQSPSEGP